MHVQAFAPLLGTDTSCKRTGTPGRIINMSSVYGSYGVPFNGPYCTSKSALDGLSDTLRLEMRVYGIKVSVIRPGVRVCVRMRMRMRMRVYV